MTSHVRLGIWFQWAMISQMMYNDECEMEWNYVGKHKNWMRQPSKIDRAWRRQHYGKIQMVNSIKNCWNVAPHHGVYNIYTKLPPLLLFFFISAITNSASYRRQMHLIYPKNNNHIRLTFSSLFFFYFFSACYWPIPWEYSLPLQI